MSGIKSGIVCKHRSGDACSKKLSVFPHVRTTIEDAFRRAEMPGIEAIDGIETHDCFTISEYMAIDHFGLTRPGESWKSIEGAKNVATLNIGGSATTCVSFVVGI